MEKYNELKSRKDALGWQEDYDSNGYGNPEGLCMAGKRGHVWILF